METRESLEILDNFLERKRKLNSTQAKEIFERDILGSVAAEKGELKNPVFLVVGGQPAAGKTAAIAQLWNKFDPDYTQIVSENELKSYLPDNNRARLRGSHMVEEINRFVVSNWRDQLIEYAVRHRSNIILETRDTPNYILLSRVRHIGYKTELNIVATDRITSFTAMHDRFDRELSQDLIATITSPDAKAHNLGYSLWACIAASSVCANSFDRIAIIRRTGEIIFENKQANGLVGPMTTIGERGAMQALMIARNRPLKKTHRDEIINIWNKLEESDKFARHLPCTNLPIKSYKTEIGLALNNQGDFDPYKIPAYAQKHMAEVFVRTVKQDVDLITANMGDLHYCDSLTLKRIALFHNLLKEELLGKSVAARTGPSDSTVALQEHKTSGSPNRGTPERSFIPKRKRADHDSPEVSQSKQQVSDAAKLQRPKFLVEVSQGIYRPIGEYQRPDRVCAGYPNVDHKQSDMNVLIRLEGSNGYETPASLKAWSDTKNSDLFAKTMSEGELPQSLASHSSFVLPAVLIDAGNGRTFLADEKICSKTTGQIPQTIPHERILVRNERGGYDELTQRLAANTLSTLPTATKQRLGPLLVETTIGIPTSASRMQLMNCSRDDAIERE